MPIIKNVHLISVQSWTYSQTLQISKLFFQRRVAYYKTFKSVAKTIISTTTERGFIKGVAMCHYLEQTLQNKLRREPLQLQIAPQSAWLSK